MSEVECIVGDLEEKHGEGKFSPEQILVWANMLQMKKHTSYDEPPNKAFFRNCKSNSNCKSNGPEVISPAKRITLRSECIDQLDKWNEVLLHLRNIRSSKIQL